MVDQTEIARRAFTGVYSAPRPAQGAPAAEPASAFTHSDLDQLYAPFMPPEVGKAPVFDELMKGIKLVPARFRHDVGLTKYMGGVAFDDAAMRDEGKTAFEAARGELQATPAAVPSLENVEGAGDVGRFLAFQVPQQATSFAASLGGAAAGGVAGGAVAGPPGAVAGIAAGGFGASFVLNAGETFAALIEEGVDERRALELSGLVAVPQALLDTFLPAKIAARVAGVRLSSVANRAARGLVRRVGAEGAKGLGVEAVTEAGQTAIKQGAVSYETGQDPLTAKNAWELADAAVAGGALGGLAGAASGVMRDPAPRPSPQPTTAFSQVPPAAQPVPAAPAAPVAPGGGAGPIPPVQPAAPQPQAPQQETGGAGETPGAPAAPIPTPAPAAAAVPPAGPEVAAPSADGGLAGGVATPYQPKVGDRVSFDRGMGVEAGTVQELYDVEGDQPNQYEPGARILLDGDAGVVDTAIGPIGLRPLAGDGTRKSPVKVAGAASNDVTTRLVTKGQDDDGEVQANTGIRDVEADQGKVSSADARGLSELRSEGDRSAPDLGQQLSGVSRPRRPEAESEPLAGSDRRETGLRARERPLGDGGGAIAEPTGVRAGDQAPRSSDDRGGMGAASGAERDNDLQPSRSWLSAGAGLEPVADTPRGTSSSAGPRRGDASSEGLGAQSRIEADDTARAPEAGLDSGSSANDTNLTSLPRGDTTKPAPATKKEPSSAGLTVESYADAYLRGEGRGDTPADRDMQQFAQNNAEAIEAEFQRRREAEGAATEPAGEPAAGAAATGEETTSEGAPDGDEQEQLSPADEAGAQEGAGEERPAGEQAEAEKPAEGQRPVEPPAAAEIAALDRLRAGGVRGPLEHGDWLIAQGFALHHGDDTWSLLPAGRRRLVALNEAEKRRKAAETGAPPVEDDRKPDAPEQESDDAELSAPEQIVKFANALQAQLRDILRAGGTLDWREFFRLADQSFGGTRAAGTYTSREAFEALELAINQYVLSRERETGVFSRGRPQESADNIERIVQATPTQTIRDAEQISFQQFSTPAHYSWVAGWVANIGSGDIVLEPSAGTGSLATQGLIWDAAEVYVNELAPRRRKMLVASGMYPEGHVFGENAEHINATVAPKVKPTVVLMNPPFSQTGGRMGTKRDIYVGANHIEAALKGLEPGGRLVAIVGRGMSEDAPKFRAWWAKIGKSYAVRANIAVDGKVYAKYGTSFDTRLLVFDKVDPDGKAVVKGEAATVADLVGLLKEVRDGRTAVGERAPAEPAGAKAPETGGVSSEPGETVPGPTAPVGDVAGEPERGGSGRREDDDAPAGGPEGAPPPADGGAGAGAGAENDQQAGPERGGAEGAGSAGSDQSAGTDLNDLFDKALEDALPSAPAVAKARSPRRPRAPKSAGQAASDAASNAKKGLDEIAEGIRGLADDLLKDTSGAARLPDLDEVKKGKLYAHFIAAAEHFKEAAGDVAAFMRALIKALNETYKFTRDQIAALKPYIVAFVADVQSGAVKLGPAAPENTKTSEDMAGDDALDAGQFTSSLFIPYAPQRLAIEGAKPHPGKLVQTSAMAAVLPPAPTYTPMLDPKAIEDGLLSLAQLEAITYAGQAHETFLPAGEKETPIRRGFFIGDGTGVGKGREIAGMMVDNWNRGRRKAVWLTKDDNKLLLAAQRDYKGVGGDPEQIFKKPSDPKAPIKAKQGILLVSYTSLAKPARLKQVIDWLGPEFGGLIAFDEAHKMGNAIARKGKRGMIQPSATALAGVDLQAQLPNARIAYVSATGATELYNLAYADRLGIWGRGTPFADKREFFAKIGSAGIAAMELVARDMKALGSYLSRSLSFEDVAYDRLEHPLTPLQAAMYDRLAEAWQVVLANVNEALKETGADKNAAAKSAAMSAFWSTHQRFFNQIITSMQMPSVLDAIEQDLKNGHAAVLQLVNTNEAQQEREIAKHGEEDLDELDITPRDALLEMVRKSFPVIKYEEYVDENGNVRTRPVLDAEGKPVEDPVQVARRERLLRDLAEIKVPQGPLELLLDHFGEEKVAEATGRSRRVVWKEDDDGARKKAIQKRNASAVNGDIAAFQQDKKQIIVFSDAGGTGVDYHASLEVPNQRVRRHYLIQAGWRADNAVQGLGRTHRSNQKQAPVYSLVTTDLKGQKRFISSIARRLDQLGALTRGQKQAGSTGLFSAADNLESDYARYALFDLIWDVLLGKVEGLSEDTLSKELGLSFRDAEGQIVTSKFPDVPRFLNRILSMKVVPMGEIFDMFFQRLTERVEMAQANGTFSEGVETFPAAKVEKIGESVLATDERTGAETKLVEFKTLHKIQAVKWEQVNGVPAEPVSRFLRNRKSGRIYGLRERRTFVQPDGSTRISFKMWSPRGFDWVDENALAGGRYEEMKPEAAKALWEKELAEMPEFSERKLYLVEGVLLPVWDRISGWSQVYRLATTKGERHLGVRLGPKALKEVRKRFGQSPEAKLPPETLFREILDGATLVLANDWKIEAGMRGGQRRVILDLGNADLTPARKRQLERDGVFFEISGWREQSYLPANDVGPDVLRRIIKEHPVAELKGGKDRPATAPDLDDAFDVEAMLAASTEPKLNDMERAGLGEAIRQAWADMGLPAENLILADRLEIRGENAERAAARTGMAAPKNSRVIIGGATDGVIAYVALADADPTTATWHEGFHVLENAGAFAGYEKVLEASTDRLRPLAARGLSEATGDAYAPSSATVQAMSPKEVRAYSFQVYQADRRRDRFTPGLLPAIRRAFGRLYTVLDRVRNYLAGLGYTSVRDLFEQAATGEAAARGRFDPANRKATVRQWSRKAFEDGTLRMEDWERELEGDVPGVNAEIALMITRQDGARLVREAFTGAKADPGIELRRPRDARDVPFWKRWIYTPEAIFGQHSPAFSKVWKRIAKLNEQQSTWVRELRVELSEIVKPLSKERMLDMAALLFKGDALEREFTAAELRAGEVEVDGQAEPLLTGNGVPDDVAAPYARMRRFMSKMGRLIDQHERAMRPDLRRQKFSLIGHMKRVMDVDGAGVEFRRSIERLLALHSKMRRADYATASGESPAELEMQIRAAEREVFGRWVEEDGNISEAIASLFAELLTVEARLQKTSVQRKKGYFPHKFFGSWQVVQQERVNLADLPEEFREGETIKASMVPAAVRDRLMAAGDETLALAADENGRGWVSRIIAHPKSGFYPDADTAIRAANAHKAGNPDANLIVKPVEFKFPNSDATELSDRAYWRFVGRVSDLMGVEVGEALDQVQGVARRRYRRRIPGFKQLRKGLEGYSREFDQVINAHIGQVARYVTMDKAKYLAINAIEREGLSTRRSTVQERPVLAAIVNNWFRDVNGQKQQAEAQIDEIFNKPWATPLNAGLASGTAAFLATGGITGNPLVGALIGSYVGYRFYAAAKTGGSFKSRALTGAMLSDMAHLKLGAFFNVFSAVVNLSQTVINTFPVLGARDTMAGFNRYIAAVTKGRNALETPAGRQTQAHRDFLLLRRANVNTAFRQSEMAPHLFEQESKIARGSLFLFNQAENLNRGVAFLGAHAKAEAAGATPGAAFRQASDVLRRTQFDYSNVNKPELLRSVFLRVPLQFKNFMVQQIAFMVGLRGKEIPRFAVALFLMAGVLGLPFLDLLDVLMQSMFDFSPLDEVKRLALQAQAAGELNGLLADFLVRGLPSLAGLDISTRTGMGERFLPLEARDWKGPWFSTLDNAAEFGKQNATMVDQIKNLSPGLGNPLKVIEAYAAGLPLIETALTAPDRLYEALGGDRRVLTSPWKRGRVEYEPTGGELALKAAGGMPLREAKLRDLSQIAQRQNEEYGRESTSSIDAIVSAIKIGDADGVQKAMTEASSNGVIISPRQIRDAIKRANMPRLERLIEQTRKPLRPEVRRLYESLD